MKQLSYSIKIDAPARRVWECIVDPGKYEQWSKAFAEGSHFEGEWKEGAQIRFLAPEMGGTKAEIKEFEPNRHIRAEHIAMIDKEGREDSSSPEAKKWVGVQESYDLTEKGGVTEFTAKMDTTPEFEKMFEESWPKALRLLKSVAEGRA